MRKITCFKIAILFLLSFNLLALPLPTCSPALADQPQAAPSQEAQDPQKACDPYENTNRKIFNFNDRLYFCFIKPLVNAYDTIPPPVRKVIRNGFDNLQVPAHFVNFVLQGSPQMAGDEMTRFVINSTVGIGGMFDVANNALGVPDHYADFGQTLGKWNVPTGAYLVVPALGPSDQRDLVGYAVDKVMDPLFWIPGEWWVSIPPSFVNFTSEASVHSGEYETLKKASLDPYVAMRNGYLQHREHLITK
jgi:phospholipid-binding lipoprotein MlaA